MTPERWRQVDAIFQAAIEQEEGRRAAFLTEACGGDAALRREVEALLASHEQAKSFIETPAADWAAQALVDEAAAPMAGRRIGPYKTP